MLSSENMQVEESTYPEFSFSPEHIRIKLSGSIYNPEKSTFPEIPIDTTTIFLKHYCEQWRFQNYTKNSKITLRNDCNSAIQNLTLTLRKKEVFFLPELAVGKTVTLSFLKHNTYDMHFWTISSANKIQSSLKITAPVKLTTGIKQNFKTNWIK
jgi:hypothetical protein